MIDVRFRFYHQIQKKKGDVMSITHLCVHKLYKNYQLMAVYNFEILAMIMFILVGARGKRCDLDRKKK